MNPVQPILYSFRRCPYAMRARLAISVSGLTVELREVVLRNKPKQLLDISSKGTVPVLLLNNGTVVDESLDIMTWALTHKDNHHWLNNGAIEDMNQLIQWNDGEFKNNLDHYKYADRYPQQDQQYYRDKATRFLLGLEKRLSKNTYLCSEKVSLADMAIFPFVRQFANVDIDWFKSSEFKKLNLWLTNHVESALFISIMDKYPAWRFNNEILYFPTPC